jgi:hypothetical protein
MEDQADSEDEAKIKGGSGPGQSQEVWMSVWIWDHCRSKSGFEDVDTECGRSVVEGNCKYLRAVPGSQAQWWKRTR